MHFSGLAGQALWHGSVHDYIHYTLYKLYEPLNFISFKKQTKTWFRLTQPNHVQWKIYNLARARLKYAWVSFGSCLDFSFDLGLPTCNSTSVEPMTELHPLFLVFAYTNRTEREREWPERSSEASKVVVIFMKKQGKRKNLRKFLALIFDYCCYNKESMHGWSL